MSETKELKPKSFRIDEETADKFKNISAELGNNQQQTLSKLIEAYEFQKGKTVLVQKKDEIETFEKYVTLLTRMYMTSLENNQNVTEVVRTEFDALLGSKDDTIIKLQKEVKEAQIKASAWEEELKLSKQQLEEQKRFLGELQSQLSENQGVYEGAIEDKEKLIKALTEASESVKKDLEAMAYKVVEANSIAAKKQELQREYNELEARCSKLQEEYNKNEVLHQRELLQKEIEFAKQLQEAERKHKQEIDQYQQKYFELLNRLQEKSKPIRVVARQNKENSK